VIAAAPRRALGSRLAAAANATGDAAGATLLVAGLGGLVLARWAATVGGVAGALPIGLAFGVGLVALVLAASPRARSGASAFRAWPLAAEVFAGVLGGLALVGLAVGGRIAAGWLGTPPLPSVTGPALGMSGGAGFGPWAAVTALVAVAEELVLRGVLFGAIVRARGPGLAVGITTGIFALMHVPLYGWHVVPLDLAVGLVLAGLRLTTRGVGAPAIAHVVADLATWWL
jgi:membrane protease YdiL (CAAX protease family)